MTLKKFIKKLLRSQSCISLCAWLGAKYMGLILRTNSWQRLNEHIPQAYWQQNKAFIGCSWHGRLAMLSFAWRNSAPIHILISAHRDGQIISKVIGHHGIKTIAGSSSKGGKQALHTILKTLKAGHNIGITPDGPRGPRFQVNPGVIAIARMAKVDIIPLTFSTSRRKVLNSWDRLILPLPFGRGVFIWGQPITYQDLKQKDKATEITTDLQQRLNTLCAEADTLCGHTPIEESTVVAQC